ncbi:hypothetical protein AMECASPLE_008791, partial [Ameca splendens]
SSVVNSRFPSAALPSLSHSCSTSPLIALLACLPFFPPLPQYVRCCFLIFSRWILLLCPLSAMLLISLTTIPCLVWFLCSLSGLLELDQFFVAVHLRSLIAAVDTACL